MAAVRQTWWRATAAGSLAAVVSLVPVQSASAETTCQGSSPCVYVDVTGGSGPDVTQEFSLSDITDSPTGTYNYTLRYPDGSTLSIAQQQPARTLDDLLTSMGVAPQSVTYAVVALTSGQSQASVLRQVDLSGASATNGQQPSVFATGGALAYFRPLRSSTDVNSTEYGQTGGVIQVTAHVSGHPLGVSLRAPTTKVRVGDSTTFTATMAGNTATTSAPQGTLTYSWSLPAGTATVRHAGRRVSRSVTWGQKGTFTVSVVAEDSAGNYALSNPVTVTVGKKPPPGGGTGPGGGHHHKHHHPPTGPVHGHGHQNHGHRHGSDHHHQGQSSGDPSSSNNGHDGPSHQGVSHGRSTPGPRKNHSGPSASRGSSIKGLLLTGARIYSAPQSARAVPRIAAEAARPRDQWSLPWTIAGGIAVPMLLLGLGMAGEALRLRRRVARMSA